MAIIRLEVVTAERLVLSEDVDMVVAPGIDGELGILPNHAPLMTMLQPGELRAKRSGEEFDLVITGGFLEVRPDRVIVLADAAERSDEIDIERAEEAKRRAEERLSQRFVDGLDAARAEAAMRRSMTRIKLAQKKRKRLSGR